MADQERENERRAQGTSINPTFNAANVFSRDHDTSMSRPSDAPLRDLSPANGAGGARPVAAGQLTADPMNIDEPAPTTSAIGASGYSPANQRGDYQQDPHGRSSPSDSYVEERSNKALTYPPRPDQIVDRREPSRQLSLPNANSTRSPSARRHRCPHCTTEFTRHHNLKSHLLTHSHEKPFACEDCNQKFRRLHDLKRHQKLHTGERPHVCDKCNRKFARGDALARHSKGPGGCAGRRNSVGDDEDGADASSASFIDPNMEGVVYDHQNDGEARRKSAPDNGRKRSLHISSTGSQSSRQTSTYPPVAPMGRPDAPAAEGNFHGPSHLSPRMLPGSGQTVIPFSSTAFSQGGSMTESPTPLSPGVAESRRLSAGLPPPRARSPSVATSLAQHHISRGHGSPSISLPGSQMSHAPQLPSISGLGADSRARTSYPSPTGSSYSLKSARPTPSITTHPPSASVNGTGSSSSVHTGSTGSLHRSSGGSMREVLGNSGASSGDEWFRDYVRRTEAEKQAMRDEFSAKQADYETRIADLQAEIAGLGGRRSSGLPPPHAAA